MKKKNKKKNDKLLLFIVGVLILFMVILLIIKYNLKSEKITNVKKVFKEDYSNVVCIDSDCTGIVAYKNNKDNTDVKIYDNNGKLSAKYNQKTSTKKTQTPYALKKNYFLKLIKTKQKDTYSINNLNGSIVYQSNNKLTAINENYILETKKSSVGEKYDIILKNGEVKYSNVSEFSSYDDGNIIYFEFNGDEYLLDENVEVIIKNYKIEKEINDKENKNLYLILKKESNYYYFNIKNKIIIGNSFDTYTVNKDNSLTINYKENNKIYTQEISSSGNISKAEETKSNSSIMNLLSNKISSDKYYIYNLSALSENQDNILVDNKEEKSFGMYNLKNNKYEKVYEYASNNFYSTISKIDSKDKNTYLQITCDTPICSENKLILYRINDSKIMFEIPNTNFVAEKYIQFENNYKVIKYSNLTDNEEYRGKYVLYDDKNNEVLKSDSQINLIDSDYVTGEIDDKSIVLYSSKTKSLINDESSLAERIIIKGKEYYKYTSNSKIILLNVNTGKKYSIDSKGSILYTSTNIYTIIDKEIKMYGLSNNDFAVYKLNKNEIMTNGTSNTISPIKNVIFINNVRKKYYKIINSDGSILKKVNGSNIYDAVESKNGNIVIITSKKVKNKLLYGFYIAK